MKFEQPGNLGKTALLQRHLMLKGGMEKDTVELTREEMAEIDQQLSQFQYLLSNLRLHQNSIHNAGYTTFAGIADELGHYLIEYDPERDE